MPKIDLGQVEEFEAVPAATYEVTLSKWEYVEETGDHGAYVKLEFTIDDGEYEGRKLWRNLSAKPDALIYMKKALVALGAEEEDISGEFDTDDVFPDLIGNSCAVVVTVKDYEGEPQNEVKRIVASRVAA